VRSLFLLIFLILAPHLVLPENFEFKHKTGDKFRILSTTEEKVYLNGEFLQSSGMVNRMASVVSDIKGDVAWHEATFNVAQEITKKNGAAQLQWAEEYKSVFGRNKKGKITIDKTYFMPTVRDIPYFPDKDLKAGDIWKSDGEEVLDLRNVFEIKNPYSIPFSASNTYVGEKIIANKKYNVFNISYKLFKRDIAEGFEDSPRTYLQKGPQPKSTKEGIRVITGEAKQTIYWDAKLGQIAIADDEFSLQFELTSGEKYLFKGKTHSEIIEAPALDKEEALNDIKKELEVLGVEDASVRITDEGISISLENIQFPADSSELLPSEKIKLEKISGILRKYNERDILVGGHTALAGLQGSRMRLSQERAASVASYFIQENVRPPNRIIVRGFGAERPVADNKTEEGKKKNRRVEITILEN
jgi:outer membrane protein OmpA-like peptidoglycan-associated protein